MTEVLDVIKELGGVKKFKELVEAMSATETDAIPFQVPCIEDAVR